MNNFILNMYDLVNFIETENKIYVTVNPIIL